MSSWNDDNAAILKDFTCELCRNIYEDPVLSICCNNLKCCRKCVPSSCSKNPSSSSSSHSQDLISLQDINLQIIKFNQEKKRKKYICVICQDYSDHPSSKCPDLICKNCKINGHPMRDCPQLKKDQEKPLNPIDYSDIDSQSPSPSVSTSSSSKGAVTLSDVDSPSSSQQTSTKQIELSDIDSSSSSSNLDSSSSPRKRRNDDVDSISSSSLTLSPSPERSVSSDSSPVKRKLLRGKIQQIKNNGEGIIVLNPKSVYHSRDKIDQTIFKEGMWVTFCLKNNRAISIRASTNDNICKCLRGIHELRIRDGNYGVFILDLQIIHHRTDFRITQIGAVWPDMDDIIKFFRVVTLKWSQFDAHQKNPALMKALGRSFSLVKGQKQLYYKHEINSRNITLVSERKALEDMISFMKNMNKSHVIVLCSSLEIIRPILMDKLYQYGLHHHFKRLVSGFVDFSSILENEDLAYLKKHSWTEFKYIYEYINDDVMPTDQGLSCDTVCQALWKTTGKLLNTDDLEFSREFKKHCKVFPNKCNGGDHQIFKNLKINNKSIVLQNSSNQFEINI